MRSITITAIVCLALSVFGFQSGKAQEEPIPCNTEPTDMYVDYGDLITCPIDSIGDTDVFRFNGKKDEVVSLLVSKTSGSLFAPCIELIAPDDTRLSDCKNRTYSFIDTTLDQTGTYTILISAYYNNRTGGYTLNPERLIPPTSGTPRIIFGETINDAINIVGDRDLFFFEGSAGDDIKTLVSKTSGSLFAPCIELIAPDDTRLSDCKNRTYSFIDTTLDQTGTYTILISAYYNNRTGGYALNLQCLDPPCGEDGPDDVFCNGRKATIVGTEGNDILIGTDGPDVIHGLGGVDIIRGMGGDDIICGGDAADFLSGVDGNDKIFGEHGDDAIWGGPGDDIIDGGDGHDSIKGGDGNDELNGGDGHDVLDGLAGNDILNGNYGNDTLYGGNGVDELNGGWGPNNGTIDNNDTCYDTAGTVKSGCEVFYEE